MGKTETWMNMQLRLILWLSLLAVVVLFVAQNAQVVELRLFVWRLALSQALLLFFAVLAGFGLGWILHAYMAWKRARGAGHADSGRAAGRGGPFDRSGGAE